MEITNKLVGELVMGWTQREPGLWDKGGGMMFIGPFSPLRIGSDDLQILRVVRRWLDEDEKKYNRFWTALSEQLRSRDPYYNDTVNQYELHYLDLYEIGDFARAAFAAVTAIPVS